jgi:lysophospholipase L1-like esterase
MNRRAFLHRAATAAIIGGGLISAKSAIANGERWLFIGDSRTLQGGWPDVLMSQLNGANVLPYSSYRINQETALDWSYTQLGPNAAQYLADSSSSLGYFERIGIQLGEHDMVGSTTSSIGTNATLLVDAINAKFPSAKLYIDFPWALPADANYASAKSQLQAVIAARSSFCFAGVDQGVVLKGGDNGASETSDGIHFSSIPATCTAYATALRTAAGL